MGGFHLFFSVLFYFGFTLISFAQSHSSFKIPDSLKAKTFEELDKIIIDSNFNDSVSNIYANTYIQKAKAGKDTQHLANGYYYMANILSKKDIRLHYLDSLIALTKNKEDSIYPAQAYLLKGSLFHSDYNHKEALDNYLLAYDFAKKNTNLEILNNIEYNIGILKVDLGEYQEALHHFKTCIKYENAVNYNNHSTLHTLASTYKHLKQLDSATFYNKKGLDKIVKRKQKGLWYYQFVSNQGIIEYYKKKYNIAIDSITKTIPFYTEIQSDPSLCLLYSYLGRSYYHIGESDKGIDYLIKATNLFIKNKNIIPETRDNYELLINHYKKKNDYKNQLRYINQLILFDSILQQNYKYLSKKIITNYDNNKLLIEKNTLIAKLQNQKDKILDKNSILTFLLVIIGSLTFYFFYKQKRYKKRFNRFIENQKDIGLNSKKTISKKQVDVPKKIVDEIIQNLKEFETKNEFTDQTITLNSLSKKLNTNSKYLSIVINSYEHKSFRTYINDLRIQYAIKRLQADTIYRKYDIKTIAHEAGFNHAETFAKTFYKYSGVYPSFFIKQLEK
ncbi:helix-turn-helix domain-containing protein [Flavobacteriaceae bacterium R38]|nr:helix-turn-helix domain-containing protein [Flavobacteriaceae bacterium R38]